MQIIEELQSGFSTAANGTANVYARGTSTPVIYYTDFEGLSPVTAGTAITLDSQGAAQVYVNQLITLIVQDSSGTTVSDSQPGDAAPLTEVRSLSFTGTDYVTAASAVGNPTTLQAILDLVIGSFGSTDFNVTVNGVTTTLKAALASSTGLYFNVIGYGATGDGTTDDNTAITAAVAAAAVAGGTVFFPPAAASGFYRTSLAIALPENVNILGAGPKSSVLKADSATAHVITTSDTATGAPNAFQYIANMTLTHSQTSTGSAIVNGSSMPLMVENCVLGGSLTDPTTTLLEHTSGSSWTRLKDTNLVIGNNSSCYAPATASLASFDGCGFSGQSATQTASIVAPLGVAAFLSCIFDGGNHSAGSYSLLDLTGATMVKAEVTDCSFLGGSGTSTTAAIATPPFGGGTNFSESGSSFGPNVDVKYEITVDFSGYPTLSSSSSIATRDSASDSSTIVAAAGTKTLDSTTVGNHFVEMTGSGTTQTFDTDSNLCFPGARLTLVVKNNGSATVTFTFTGTYFATMSSQTLAATFTKAWSFVYQATTTSTGRWVNTGVTA